MEKTLEVNYNGYLGHNLSFLGDRVVRRQCHRKLHIGVAHRKGLECELNKEEEGTVAQSLKFHIARLSIVQWC